MWLTKWSVVTADLNARAAGHFVLEVRKLTHEDESTRRTANGKKRHGPWVVWLRYTHSRDQIEWTKYRSYAKREVAELAMRKALQKYGGFYEIGEIRFDG